MIDGSGRVLAYFQSHLGSIAAGLGWSWRSAPWRLSIPPWFDCGKLAGCGSLRWRMLSIPPWFDCGQLPPGPEADSPSPFNPTLVRLRRLPRSAGRRPHIRFQSHLGSIAAAQGKRPRSDWRRLSIPPWFDCGSKGGKYERQNHPAFNPTLVRLRRW